MPLWCWIFNFRWQSSDLHTVAYFLVVHITINNRLLFTEGSAYTSMHLSLVMICYVTKKYIAHIINWNCKMLLFILWVQFYMTAISDDTGRRVLVETEQWLLWLAWTSCHLKHRDPLHVVLMYTGTFCCSFLTTSHLCPLHSPSWEVAVTL